LLLLLLFLLLCPFIFCCSLFSRPPARGTLKSPPGRLLSLPSSPPLVLSLSFLSSLLLRLLLSLSLPPSLSLVNYFSFCFKPASIKMNSIISAS
jgi:hypothetical protein